MLRLLVIALLACVVWPVAAQSWLMESRIVRQMQLLDGDGDGGVSEDEYIGKALALFDYADINRDKKFDYMDSALWREQERKRDGNGDGYTSFSEIRESLFRAADTDADGALSEQEFVARDWRGMWFVLDGLPPLVSQKQGKPLGRKAYKKSAVDQFKILDADEDDVLTAREMGHLPRVFRGARGGGFRVPARRGDKRSR